MATHGPKAKRLLSQALYNTNIGADRYFVDSHRFCRRFLAEETACEPSFVGLVDIAATMPKTSACSGCCGQQAFAAL
jgi:hypothetical protein